MDALLVSPARMAGLEEQVLLMRRMLSETAPPVRRRGWLLEHCRRTGADERQGWRALARYRQAGAPALLASALSRSTIFDRHTEYAREAILSLLIDAPPCVLSEFQELAELLELIADRLRFLCEWALEVFLDPAPGRHGGAYEQDLAIEALLRKLAEEVERLRELFDQWPRLSVAELGCEYRDWLGRRAMVDEREDVE